MLEKDLPSGVYNCLVQYNKYTNGVRVLVGSPVWTDVRYFQQYKLWDVVENKGENMTASILKVGEKVGELL